jgi:hypothetical protein
MGGKKFGFFGIELSYKLINIEESLDTFAKHLLLNFIENLVWFVFPVHSVTKIYKLNQT